MIPHARRDGLAVRAIGDETVIYDQARSVAHRLNRSAALVWHHCDGRTDVRALSTMVRRKTGLAEDDRFVWFALDELDRARLLLTHRPASGGRITRRELLGLVRGDATLLPRCESVKAASLTMMAAFAGGASGAPAPLAGLGMLGQAPAQAKKKCEELRMLITVTSDDTECVGEKQACTRPPAIEIKLLQSVWRGKVETFCADEGECDKERTCLRDGSVVPPFDFVRQLNRRECTDKDKPILCIQTVSAFAFCVCPKDE